MRQINEPIFYITNDVGRGVGLESVLPNYHIVCLDNHPLIDILKKNNVSVFCLERILGKKNILPRNSGIILSHPLVLSFIKERSKGRRPNILFFKPQRKIEIIADKLGFNLIGNRTAINRLFEDKVSFFDFCLKSGIKVPEGEIADLSLAKYTDLTKKYGEILVIQYGRGWAGNSTFFIKNEQEWGDLKKKVVGLAKVSRFIKGVTILNNAVIFGDSVLVSKPALQVKTDSRLTSTQSGTGGRQWPVELQKDQEEKMVETTKMTGKIMGRKGYRGFFGLDFLVEEETGEVYLSENNARLTASVPFYTKLEMKSNSFPLLGYHLLAFLPRIALNVSKAKTVDVSGGEIVVRNNQPYPVKAVGYVKTGIYDRKLNFVRDPYYLDTVKLNDFWVTAIAAGRIVNPEIEILRLNTFAKICEKDGSLKEEYFEVIKTFKENLLLEKC